MSQSRFCRTHILKVPSPRKFLSNVKYLTKDAFSFKIHLFLFWRKTWCITATWMTINGVFSLILFSYTMPLEPRFTRIDLTKVACIGKRQRAGNISSNRMTAKVMEKAWDLAHRKRKKFWLIFDRPSSRPKTIYLPWRIVLTNRPVFVKRPWYKGSLKLWPAF